MSLPSQVSLRKRQEPPARARAGLAQPLHRNAGRAETCGLLCRRSCVQLFVVSTSAAPDSKASRDPGPAELIRFPYQAGSPATPPRRPPCPRILPHQTSNTHPACPHRTRQPWRAPPPVPGDLVHRRQLEKSVSWSGRERLRCLWYRLRLTVAEMNYATRRTVELQAPWISDDHPGH